MFPLTSQVELWLKRITAVNSFTRVVPVLHTHLVGHGELEEVEPVGIPLGDDVPELGVVNEKGHQLKIKIN